MEQDIKQSRKKSAKIKVTERDVDILGFLDRVGYANITQVTKFFSGSYSEDAILARLYVLKRFGYIKIFSTQHGNYYALLKIAGGENALINSIKLDQLKHHDYLVNLFLIVKQHDNTHELLSEREAIAKFKIVGRTGKIPDMVINNWIIEYERTNKSTTDCRETVNYWIYNQNKHLCVIYESEEIKNRYEKLVNSEQLQLVASHDLNKILQVVSQKVVVIDPVDELLGFLNYGQENSKKVGKNIEPVIEEV